MVVPGWTCWLVGRPWPIISLQPASPGDVEGEDLYAAFGRTQVGRYLTVFFIYKTTREALVVSARDMTRKERKTYGKIQHQA
jgi:uncharacterized DUF497 family protein